VADNSSEIRPVLPCIKTYILIGRQRALLSASCVKVGNKMVGIIVLELARENDTTNKQT